MANPNIVNVSNIYGRTIFDADIATSASADATLVVISKDTSIYLLEDRAIYVAASAAGDLSATCSYDQIS